MSIKTIKTYFETKFKSAYSKPCAIDPIIGPILLIAAADKDKEAINPLPKIESKKAPAINKSKNKKKKPKISLTDSSLSAFPL